MAIENNMLIIPKIDYQKIVDAVRHYTESGYEEIQVPWIVNFESYSATDPKNNRQFVTLDGYLNASGEQGFINLLINGEKLSKNFCITPCFRDEPILDEIHHKYFFKLELIDTDVSLENLFKLIDIAKSFFEKYLEVEVIKTGLKSYDIIDKKNKIEIGSYGIREYKSFTWIYGTGIALPRFDYVLDKNK